MMKERQTTVRERLPESLEDFFQIPGKGRSANLIASQSFERPGQASVDAHGNLTWHLKPGSAAGRRPRLRAIPGNLCFEFARRADASVEQIRKFAEQWGPLGYNPPTGTGAAVETVEQWRRYMTWVRAILRLARHRFTVEFAEQDARLLLEIAAPGASKLKLFNTPRQTQNQIRESRRWDVARALNFLYARIPGNGIIHVVGDRFCIQLHGSNLLGILIAQVAYKLANVDQKIPCSGCPNSFVPVRPTTSGTRQYCPKCRRGGVSRRDAARDYRKRKKAQTLK
jgi:hypothetical protein